MGAMGLQSASAVLCKFLNTKADLSSFFLRPSAAIGYMKGMAYATGVAPTSDSGPAFRLASWKLRREPHSRNQPINQTGKKCCATSLAQGERPIIAGVLMEFISHGGSAALLRQGRRVQASVIRKEVLMSSLLVWDEGKPFIQKMCIGATFSIDLDQKTHMYILYMFLCVHLRPSACMYWCFVGMHGNVMSRKSAYVDPRQPAIYSNV